MSINSGIILAGGTGSRLAPLNDLFNKHMIPVYNKFIIDYPLDTLKNLGVKNVTVVLGGSHFSQVVSHVKDGSHLGMSVNYVYQDKPLGIAQAINLCEKYVVQNDRFVTILGDNIFENSIKLNENSYGAQIVLHNHQDLYRFGVAGLNGNKIIKLDEKPKVLDQALANYAITGCYIFDSDFFRYFQNLKPSARGEYEIIDIIRLYHADQNLGYSFVNGM